MTPDVPAFQYNRSILFSADKCHTAFPTMPDARDHLVFTVDGLALQFNGQIKMVVIDRFGLCSRFICFDNRNFYQTLNQKLKFRG
jgi:hypothetical protein